MPKLKPRKSLYPIWKADLKKRRIKTRPLFTKNNKKRASLFGQVVVKGSRNQHIIMNPSRWRRVNPQGPPMQLITKLLPQLVGGRKVLVSQRVFGHSVRLQTAKGTGKGGGGGERGPRVTGSAVARKAARARVGGKRGARSQREQRKQKAKQ